MTADPLRVAIDGRTLQASPPGGVGRSLKGMLPVLTRDARVDLLVDPRRPDPAACAGVAVHRLRLPLSGRDAPWLQIAASRWLRGYAGVFHCPFYGLPFYQPVPMVVTIHDLTFEFAPEWFRPTTRFVFRRQARWAVRTARRVLVPSDHVREMLIERYRRYGIRDEQVLVSRWAIDSAFRGEAGSGDGVLERLGLERPYVVALGGAPRRSMPVAVEAWANACERLGAHADEVPLVVVGTEPPPPRRGVRYAGPLHDAEWATVLGRARAFCYATRYEGYGLPALEALAAGTPVVCARVGSLPEVLGDAAAWCESADARSLGAALAELFADDDRHNALVAAGTARAATLPSVAEAAAVTLQAYREALDG